VREKWGLDKPLPVQYFRYMIGVLHGDFGTSVETRRSVLSDLRVYFPASLELSTSSMILCLVLGIPLGMVSAVKKDHFWDHFSRIFSLIGVATPLFWLGFMALLIFYLKLGWFAGGGRISLQLTTPTQISGLYVLDSLLSGNWPALKSSVQHLLLPTLTLSFTLIAYISRITRASMLDVLCQDYVVTARSKGLRESVVFFKHCLRNALLGVITVAGTLYGRLIGSLIITEMVFNWPGIGRYVVRSILSLDAKPVLGFTILIAFSCVIINLLVDILYAVVDPRIIY
jgi:peptide/nickel transport system permease protein